MIFKRRYIFKFGIIGIIIFILLPVFLIIKNSNHSSKARRILSKTDYRIFACGEEIIMKANTASLAAKRDGLFARSQPGVIITDGVSTSIDDSLLTSYFDAAGGTLELINENTELLQIPTDTGLREFQSGNLCNGEKAKLRVLHYRVETLTKPWSVYPQILWKYFDYVLTNNYHQILSENCLIFIFDSEEVLRKPWPLCASHEAALASGELTWGK